MISRCCTPIRLHQEDACQALGVDLEQLAGRSKYEADGGPGFRSIAALLGKWSNDPQQQLLRLLDALVFTGGIGEHSAEVRRRVCSRLGWLGATLDESANNADQLHISGADSKVDLLVIPTNEEWMMAHHAQTLLSL